MAEHCAYCGLAICAERHGQWCRSRQSDVRPGAVANEIGNLIPPWNGGCADVFRNEKERGRAAVRLKNLERCGVVVDISVIKGDGNMQSFQRSLTRNKLPQLLTRDDIEVLFAIFHLQIKRI